MLGLGRYLPCIRCGSWGSGALICPSCGALRGGGLVGLDAFRGGGGDWIHPLRGSSEELAEELQALQTGRGPEAQGRLRIARELVERLETEARWSLHIDLREVGAGRRRGRGRTAQSQVRFLPWLWGRGGAWEARITRYAQGSGAHGWLDELALQGPGGGLRVPLGEQLGELPALEPDVPEPAPLPPTAPRDERAGLLLGVLSAGVLLVLAPYLLAGVPRDPARPLRPPEVAEGPVAEVRAACVSSQAARRREGLLASGALAWPERVRVLDQAARGDPDRSVRFLAAELWSAADELGRHALVELGSDPAVPLGVRLQASLELLQRGDLEPARAGLGELRGADRLLGLRCLAWGEEELPPPLLAGVRQILALDPDPSSRATAGWLLAGRGLSGLSDELALALAELIEVGAPARAQLTLASALRRDGAPRELLRDLARRPRLDPLVRHALER